MLAVGREGVEGELSRTGHLKHDRFFLFLFVFLIFWSVLFCQLVRNCFVVAVIAVKAAGGPASALLANIFTLLNHVQFVL